MLLPVDSTRNLSTLLGDEVHWSPESSGGCIWHNLFTGFKTLKTAIKRVVNVIMYKTLILQQRLSLEEM